MKVSTDNLEGVALDWAVAKCEGATGFHYDTVATYWVKLNGKDRALSKGWAQAFTPSTNWLHAGPIIEREDIVIYKMPGGVGGEYRAEKVQPLPPSVRGGWYTSGRTYLEAAMRCYVLSKLGAEVAVPGDLTARLGKDHV